MSLSGFFTFCQTSKGLISIEKRRIKWIFNCFWRYSDEFQTCLFLNTYKSSTDDVFPILVNITIKIKEIIKTDSEKSYVKKNDLFIENYLNNLSENYDVIAGWGAYSNITESLYKERIKALMKLLKDEEIYRVG